MDISITTTTENQLLKRIEFKGTLTFTGATPAYPQIRQALATQLKVKEDVIAIKQVLTSFGATQATFTAYVYETVDQLVKIEPKIKAKKEKKAAEEKKA